MKVPSLVFRYRYWLHGAIYVLGFWAPWNRWIAIDPPGPNAHVWGILAANLAQLGVGSILTAFNLLLGLAIAFALAGAALRTWGSAYVGIQVVRSETMHAATAEADGILRDGPFARMRNPLYLGTFLHSFALALLMPRSGAIFTLGAIGLLQLYLIQGEEAYLTQTLGAPYTAYCALVPRLLPALRAKVTPTGLQPRWAQAFAGEIYFWLVALCFAALGWEYKASLLMQGVVVSVGVGLVVRALTPRGD